MIRIKSKAYGNGEFISYDPRFPGYFSGKFYVKGREIIINNLTKRDIDSIYQDDYECKIIEDDFVNITDCSGCVHKLVNKKGYTTAIVSEIDFKTNTQYWSVRFYNYYSSDSGFYHRIYKECPNNKYDLSNFLNLKKLSY